MSARMTSGRVGEYRLLSRTSPGTGQPHVLSRRRVSQNPAERPCAAEGPKAANASLWWAAAALAHGSSTGQHCISACAFDSQGGINL